MFLSKSCTQNYKGLISFIEWSVGFSAGMDWMKGGGKFGRNL